ncbi:MAG: leucyl aminopeptidase [Sedimentisphaerales bacterium]|nr:leucyl aminopeptidase [Sedimentisphaerales bacterium]
MKEIITVDLKTRKAADIAGYKADILVIGCFADEKTTDKLTVGLDRRLGGAIKRLKSLGDFKGKEDSSAVVYGGEKTGAKRILLLGLGDRKELNADTVRKASAVAAKRAVALKAKTVAFALHIAIANRLEPAQLGRAVAEGIYFGAYKYDEYVTKTDNGRLKSIKVDVVDSDPSRLAELSKSLAVGAAIGESQSYARTLANRPGNVINPPALANEAKKLARSLKNVTCTVFDEKQLKAKGMGGILAVGSGSKTPPRLITLKYNGGPKAAKKPLVALVGKAITFDSGGISIKPSANMDQMKLDKSGGIAVLAAIRAIAKLKLPVNVIGIVPSAENMPGGASYRPGDIVKTFSGKTVEILNTDAEGRMLLCDALAYAVKSKAGVIIDIATLTGACMVALGKYKAGLMGNDDNLIAQLEKASEESGESVWHMPSGKEYAKEMKSQIADLKNIGSRWGGACTAAAFLGQFVEKTTWAHLDIAGMDLFEKAADHCSEGSTGFGVRLLTAYIINLTT